jgi:hypothetical protein
MRLYEQHLAWAEPASADDLGGVERHGTGLRRDGDEAVAGDRIRTWAESVPIDHRTHAATIGERDRRRPIPRGEEAGGPPSERTQEGVR